MESIHFWETFQWGFIGQNLMENVWYNIIDNSIRHTRKDNRFISIRLNKVPNKVQIIIADNGTRIKPDDQEKIFDKFFSMFSKYQVSGSGIGFHLSCEIIQAHNGTISVQSEGEDMSTEVVIELPIYVV